MIVEPLAVGVEIARPNLIARPYDDQIGGSIHGNGSLLRERLDALIGILGTWKSFYAGAFALNMA
jgi:hypothetical protein